MRKLADRERGLEYLDDPDLPPEIASHSLRDIALANRLFGGTRAVLVEARETFVRQQAASVPTLTLLDVGTGIGDIPQALGTEAARHGIELRAVGLEITHAMASVAQHRDLATVAGDARALPFKTGSFDIVTCSLVLHHLNDLDAIAMLRECSRVARVRVIVADLRRSWMAIALLWLVSFPLRFHPISRHDGVLSVRRGYSVQELQRLIEQAVQNTAHCVARIGWRLTASWSPNIPATEASEHRAHSTS